MLGTVAAIAVFAVLIVILLLGLIITLLFVIVKKIKTVHSGEAQFTNQTTAHRYNKISSMFSIIMQIMHTLLFMLYNII